VRRNTLIGAVVGVLLAVNETRGANIDIRAFLERIPWTKEGVDSLGPVVEKNNYPGHKIEHRRHPDAIYQLFRMIHPSDDLNQPPEIRDPLLSALQKGHPLLNESELRHALEGQDQLVVDLLTREIRRLETRRAEAEAHPEPGYRDAVLRQEQLLPRLLRAMSFGKPTHILDFPFYIQPYQNAVRILLSHQPGREGPNNYSYIQMDGPGAMDRLTQLGLLFRSLGDSARLVMDAEASGLEAREDSPKLWELRHTAREIVNAFLSDHPGRRIQLRVNGEEIEPGALASRGSFQSEKYAAELAPLLAVLNSSGGPEITADTVRTARVRTYELMTRFITREEGWPMLLGYFGGPMQRMIKGGLPRPEKPTPIGIYSGGKLVEGFMVYRGRDDQPMVVNHGLLSDFKRAFPAEYGKITSVEYFNGLPLTSFLETYSRYAAQQGMGNLTYRLIPLRSLPLENALVGKVEGVNPAVLRVFLGKLEGMGPDVLGFIESNFSAHRKQMLAEVDPLYEVEWSEARGAVREIIPRYLAPFEKALGEPLRQNRLVRTFAEHGENAFRLLIRRQRDEVDTAQ
jgi:hypothetical protein